VEAIQMIAALDATPLTLTSGGLPRYVSELSLALARNFSDDRYVLLSDQNFPLPPDAPANLTGGPVTNDKRWWLRGVRRAITDTGAQIFHGTNFEVPYLGTTPAILTIHDLSPWKDPSWHGGADRVRQRTPWLIRLHRARIILTVSEAVKREIVDYFNVSEDSVRAIPLAASPLFRPTPARSPHPRPYFLYTGTLEPRKNVAALVEAWRETREQTGADLLIAGRTRADFKPIPLREGIHYLGEVSNAQLPALYSNALAFVYPTLYEGFGLSPLEAMQCGCPVITSKDPAVTEVSGGAALHAATVREIAEALRAVASNLDLRHELRDKGLARAKHFSWDNTARQTRALYEEVLTGAAR
jgi:glycosyltransferase involved in cell wall biosynthesis